MAERGKQSKSKKHKSPVEKMDGNSYNPQQELLGLLRTEFPEAFTEGKIDIKKLRRTMGEEVSEEGERYGLSWAGKSDCFRHIQEPTTATLNPVKEESVDFDNTENVFIEGDNLQVLKILQKSYYGEIKMIYIDPPFNTGNDSFIYPDRFAETQEEYLKRIGDKDIEGNLIKDGFFRKNAKDSGHFHSNWLSMMYPRLFLARNLLSKDGVVFVSIGDNEVHNLKAIMNEIFGEENFIAQFVWNTEGHTDNQYHIKINHEYILLYVKDSNFADSAIGYAIDPNTRKDSNLWKGFAENSITKNGPGNPPSEVRLPKGFPCKEEDEIVLSRTDVPTAYFDEVKKQGYISRSITQKYKVEYPVRMQEMRMKHGLLDADCAVFSGWANVNKLKNFIGNGFQPLQEKDGTSHFYLSKNGVIYYRKLRPKARNILSVLRKMGTTEQMRSYLERIGVKFQYPKPQELISYLIRFGSGQNDWVMDFFAGSSTTAHAVMNLNAEDGGNRKYICVQLAEPCEENSEAYAASFKTISDISKERIRRIAKQTAKENEGKLNFDKTKLDLGVKVFKLSESNFKIWRSDVKKTKELEKQMGLFVDNVKTEATQENILFELILKSGLDLNVSIEKKRHNGKQYFVMDEGKLIVCIEDKITQKLIDTIIKAKPEKVICLDKAFAGNDQLKTNTALQMESEKIDFKVI
jgi:adenine-specific DNA-methyltransferase